MTIVNYQRQFNEMVQLWGPVEEYTRANFQVPLGTSIPEFILRKLQALAPLGGIPEPVPSDTFVCEAGNEVPNAGACPFCGQDESGECKGVKK